MGTPTATFALELEDKTSSAALAAAGSLEKLKGQIDEDVKALREMQKAMRALKGGTDKNSAAAKRLKDQITAQKAKIASSQDAWLKLGGTFGKTQKDGNALSRAVGGLGGKLGATSGPLAAMGGGLSRLGPLLANPAALALALAAALVALAGAAVVVTAALLRFGVAAAGARREEALAIEGANSLRQMWGRATASLEEYQAAIDGASDSTNVGRGTLQTYARQLARTGLRGDALTEAVEAMGIAAQVQGDRGAARFRALAHNAVLAGGSVADLAEEYRATLGPIARRQMLSLDNQTARLRRNVDRLFDGLDIEGALGGLADVLDLFSQNTESGRALKSVLETVLQPLLDGIAEAGPVVRAFFEGVIIGGLRLGVALLRVRNAVRDALGLRDFESSLITIEAATTAGIAAFALFAAALTLVATLFAVLVVGAALFVAAMLAVPLLIAAVVAGLVGAVSEAIDFWSEVDWGGLADDMIDGLVNGITSGATELYNSVRNLAAGAADAFRDAVGARSPSTLFADFGGDITDGLSQGIDAGAPGVEDSVSGIVEAPTGGGLGGATSISIGDVNINAGESSDPRELAAAFRDELARVLEGVNVELAI